MDKFDNIFFTGYSGFLGQDILKYLMLKQSINNKITLMGRNCIGTYNRWIHLDFMQELPSIPSMEGENILIHYSALLPNNNNQEYTLFMENEKRFLEKCYDSGITDIVYASTGGVYGFSLRSNCEESSVNPSEIYSKYKRDIEKLIINLWPNNHLILRYFFPFGEGQKRPRLFPNIINKILVNDEIEINGERSGLRFNPVYINDATEAVYRLIMAGNKGTYNIAGREEISLIELVEKLSNLLNRNPRIFFSNQEDMALVGSIDKTLSVNNMLFSTPFDEALIKTVSNRSV
ncbi:NAD-dependent epimerase/dehydratase family protein [Paenibacillus allorhizosphaerae]|uniref:dTDP-4-dehydro-6-deoxyglucose reductase n=1 Tax=Paenibacillus allorhizosphaerae TaxID=2849866 RepID=A0ABM8VS65_9BACL|nr:NAD(P)-dependent oxidoreductase [Paenibacillus allorhizosphaerae]CAG7656181.1 dTDP-4-dehydro-6-deoxyglucose reductase [Paenibacillus allorhizosphaerae]